MILGVLVSGKIRTATPTFTGLPETWFRSNVCAASQLKVPAWVAQPTIHPGFEGAGGVNGVCRFWRPAGASFWLILTLCKGQLGKHRSAKKRASSRPQLSPFAHEIALPNGGRVGGWRRCCQPTRLRWLSKLRPQS